MEICSKLFAVVVPTYKAAPTLIIPITVSLPQITGSTGRAAPPSVHITPSTPPTQRNEECYWFLSWCSRLLTTVVFLMIVSSKRLAVVTSTLEISFAPSMSIMLATITRSITVSFTLTTWILRSAASSSLKIASTASLAWRRL